MLQKDFDRFRDTFSFSRLIVLNREDIFFGSKIKNCQILVHGSAPRGNAHGSVLTKIVCGVPKRQKGLCSSFVRGLKGKGSDHCLI